MPFTIQDLAAIDRKIASGVEETRGPNGEMSRSRNAADLLKLRTEIWNDLVAQGLINTAGSNTRQYRAYTTKGFD